MKINNDHDVVLDYFSELCAIPHGSGNEKKISDFLVNFAQKLGLWVKQDEAFNVIIKKPASAGYESAEPVIIQGHLDMVCEKESNKEHDFEKNGLSIIVNGDTISADGTTLGADNGIAVAMAMALCTTNTPHPALILLLTSNEETGMDGAKAIDSALFDSPKLRLINLDNESDDTCYVGCAGGLRYELQMVPDRVVINPTESVAYRVSINGLLGGHSGMMINKQRGNAIRFMARFLTELLEDCNFDFEVAHFEGGAKENVIPRDAYSVIVLYGGEKEQERFIQKIDDLNNTYRKELAYSDPDIQFVAEKTDQPGYVLAKYSAWGVISAALLLPDGVLSMNMKFPDLVESSGNVGVLRMNDNNITICGSLRSQLSSLKELHSKKILMLAELLGADYSAHGDYPAWEYAPNSPLREAYELTYRNVFGEDAKIAVIHAGLECGLFAEMFPGIDMISIGPNIQNAHTPRESVSISSTLKVWELLKALLANLH